MKQIKPINETALSLRPGFKQGLTGIFVAATLAACGSGVDSATGTPLAANALEANASQRDSANAQSGEDTVASSALVEVYNCEVVDGEHLCTDGDGNPYIPEEQVIVDPSDPSTYPAPQYVSNLPNPNNILAFALSLDVFEEYTQRALNVVNFAEDNQTQISELCLTIAEGDACAIAANTLRINPVDAAVDEELAEILEIADLTYISNPAAGEYDHQLTLDYELFGTVSIFRTISWNNNLTLLQYKDGSSHSDSEAESGGSEITYEFIAGNQVKLTSIARNGVSDFDSSTNTYFFPTESNGNVALIEGESSYTTENLGNGSTAHKFTNGAEGAVFTHSQIYNKDESTINEYEEAYNHNFRHEYNGMGEETLYSFCDGLQYDCSNPANWENTPR